MALPAGLIKEKDLQQLPQITRTPEENEALMFYIRRLVNARDQRNQPNKYFDNLDYVTDYITNENAKNTYLRPKKNNAEVRVDVGTVEKKLEAIQNELLTMNLKHDVRAYDQDDLEIQELGEDMTDIITRTEQQEKAEDFWLEFTYELLSQRAVFIEELFIDAKLGKFKIQRAQKRLVSGLKMFLGDITIPAYRYNEQPCVVKVDRMDYDTAKTLYGDNPNFKKVKSGMPNLSNSNGEFIGSSYYFRFSQLLQNEVEVITYESLPDNERQIIINSVMMYGTKQEMEFPSYSIQMFITKSMAVDFAYGRPLTASAKVLNAISSETIRLLIRKFQQALEPPIGVPKGRLYSNRMWDPSAITQGVKKGDVERLIDHNGVTEGELAMYRLIEEKTTEFIGATNIAQGINSNKESSATEILTQMRQFVKQLGLSVAAIMRAKRDMAELRIYNILINYLDPTKRKVDEMTNEVQDLYRSFTLENVPIGGKSGKKIIKFTDKDLTPEGKEELYDYEEDQARKGNPLRIKFVNVKTLQRFPILWHVVVNNEEKEGTALDKVIFQERLNQGMAISQIAQIPLNGQKIISDYERTWKAKNWFQKQPQAQNPVQGEANSMMEELSNMEGSTGAQVSRGLKAANAPIPNTQTLGATA